MMTVTDQGFSPPVEVARLRCAHLGPYLNCLSPTMCAGDGRFTLTEFQRVKNNAGELTDYVKSWLCVLITTPAIDDDQHFMSRS